MKTCLRISLCMLLALSAFGQAFSFNDVVWQCQQGPATGGGGPSLTFSTSQSLGSLRNDYSGTVGCNFTNGAASVTVTHLGRWIVSGNSQTHTVSLFAWCGNGASGNCYSLGPSLGDMTFLAQVTVNASGATPGDFKYTALGSPVSLAPNTVYCIVSSESSGGDQWYDDNTTYSPVADFVTAWSVFNDGSQYHQGTPGRCYVTVNAKYTKS